MNCGHENQTADGLSNLPVTQTADMAISQTADLPTPAIGGNVVLTLSVTNNSNSTVTNVQVKDLLPDSLVFVSATPEHGTYDQTSGIWDVGTVASRQTIQLKLTARVGFYGIVRNSATVTASVADTNNGNNSAEVALTANPVIIAGSGNFLQFIVKRSEFALWTTQPVGSTAGVARVKRITNELYKRFNDKFDFIVFALDTNIINSMGIYGQTFQTRNAVTGLGKGLDIFNNDLQYGSSGQLQAITCLYKLKYSDASSSSFLSSGPLVHEIGHRWFNFCASYAGGSHWPNYTLNGTSDANSGIFGSVINLYAPVELYLMGLINYADITDVTNKTIADKFIAESGIRSPDKSASQKNFRALVVVIAPTPLSAGDISVTDTGVNYVTAQNLTYTQVNFYRQTGGRATLKMNGLLDSDTKK
jgi:uncharacterized repeat protein (TIGR01451 family)